MPATRVLIVEDERIVAFNLKQRLVKLGYEVCGIATSGEMALAEIEKSSPDAILMDINIDGDIDGIETASRIPPEKHTPVIYLTAYSEQATLERAQATTPYGYLLKPFSERELHATLQMALARRLVDAETKESERRLAKLVGEKTAELVAANAELTRQLKEREKLEEMLAHTRKMEAIGQLTGGIAHDFNNLLQGIQGALSIVQTRISQGRFQDVDRWITQAIASTERAASLTHRLLAFSRRQPLAPKPVECKSLFHSMHDMLASALGEKITVEIEDTPDLWLTRCDENQLESALLNLAINARDAMPDGGALTIKAENVQLADGAVAYPDGAAAGDYVCVSVTDTGYGMSREVAAQAFEPFFTTKPLGQGTGLGLSMLYGFARQSGGFSLIDSELHKGTTVRVCLPRYLGTVTPEDHPAPEHSYAPTGEALPGMVIVVVEDESTIRELIVEVLRDMGYDALEATDGPKGLEVLKSMPHVDLLITDVGLPGLNGRQVADAGRTLHPDLKVLFMTGYAENIFSASGSLDAGMHLITKPVGMEILIDRLREIILS